MASPGDDTSVQVALRIRPQSAGEKIDMCHMCTSVTPGHPQVILGKDKAFTYDYVFDIESEQPTIYDTIARPLIEGCFEGYNATILAYGQTGSGKTYTMGTSFDIRIPEHTIGIIPRAARHLFEGILKRTKKAEEDGTPMPDIKVSAQFLELYNEEIIDLLDIEQKGRKLVKVHEDNNGNIYMTGVVSRPVTSGEDCMSLLEEGAISRTTASTNMNATSSRSHAIFTLQIKHHRVAPGAAEEGEETEFETLNAKFNFVDLAGSERLKRTGATGDRAKEGISINQGLLSLGNVISALGDKTKRGTHVPYRDSKLTRLLQDSLGGNSRTLMIACVSPSDRDFMETLNTLKYANRARNIKNKVMVNQDKASKQIAALRQEIQELTLELLEFKQGKRVASNDGGEYMSDTYHELEMLRKENETLRLRVKALKQTIDTQAIQVAELKVSSALAHCTDEERPVLEEMAKKYEDEIQTLKNKLMESEALSTAAMRRADNVSRVAMSPGMFSDDGSAANIIDAAKEDLRRELKLKKKLSKKFKSESPTSPPAADINEIAIKLDEDCVPMTISGDEAGECPPVTNGLSNGKSSEMGDLLEENDTEDADEEAEDEHEDDDEDDDDDDDLDTDSDSDSDTMFDNMSLKEEEVLQDNINDLNTDITIKQKLIDELEHSQQRLTALKHQYDQKLNLLHNKIKETEDERDKVLRNMGTVDSKAQDKANEVKKRYEKKLTAMQKELSKLQNSKKETQRLLKTKEQNEQQLKVLRTELGDMKKTKVKLMRQMRDEANRNKLKESKLSQKMESVLKENRKKEIALQKMKDEKKQREIVMKRKQQELNAMRKLAKPVSGNITTRGSRNRPTNLQLQFQSSGSTSLNSTFVVEASSTEPPSSAPVNISTTPTHSSSPPKRSPVSPSFQTPLNITPAPKTTGRSPAVSKRAKQKWEILERKITEFTIRMKNVAQMENDMERWLVDRERVGKQLEQVRKRKEDLEKNSPNQPVDETLLKELQNQVEGLDAHMEYIQENITESQGTIMGLEEQGEGINPSELISGCNLVETKYIMEHFYSKSIETAQELANKDAAYKEIQIKLEAMEKHCEVQQQLLQHACNYGSGVDTIEDDIQSMENDLNEQLNLPMIQTKKTRRKTATPEELLHTKDNKLKTPQLKIYDEISEELVTDSPEINRKQVLAETFQLDEKTLKKLVDLERTLKDKKTMPPPSVPATTGSSNNNNNTNIDDKLGPRSGSFNGTTTKTENNIENLEPGGGNFVRNSRVSSSARPFRKTVSASSIKKRGSNPSSARSSPQMERKSLNDTTQLSVSDMDSADVFKRLTSGLPHEGDPDLGQILPSRVNQGKPDTLVCMYTATGHNNSVLSLDVQDELMITGSKDRTAKVWDLKTSEEILSLPAHKRDVTVVKFSPTGKTLFTVNQSTIKIWDIRQGTVIKTLGSGFFAVADSSIMDLGLDKTGNVLYSAVGNSVKRIDLRMYNTLGKLTGHAGSITCLLVSETSHNNDIVITGSKDHSIKIFEVVEDSHQSPRQTLEPPHYDGVQSLAMKGNFLFSGSRDNAIKKWDFSKCRIEQHLANAHRDWVTSLSFVPGVDVVMSGDRRGLLKLWDVQNCRALGEIQAHGKSINSIKCNSTSIFTASSDRLVRIWKPSQTLEDKISIMDMDD